MSFAVVISPTEVQLDGAIGLFLKAILPAGTEVVRGQVNRVPQPKSDDYVVFWPTLKPRLATNVDDYLDCAFTGGVSGDVLTVTTVDARFPGRPGAGAPLFGTGVQAGVTITSQLSGPAGGAGTYKLSAGVSPPIAPGATLAAGTERLTRSSEIHYQMDVHGPHSGDNAAVITTIFRDGRGVGQLLAAGAALNPPLSRPLSPLWCEDPRQVPFTNDSNQWEERYVVTARLQIDQWLQLPQQFAASVSATLIEADLLPTS